MYILKKERVLRRIQPLHVFPSKVLKDLSFPPFKHLLFTEAHIHTCLHKEPDTSTGPTKKTTMSDSGEVTLVTVRTSAVYDIYSPFQYQWSCINFFLALWLLSVLFRKALLQMKYLDIKNNFYGLDETKKRNVITYIMELLVTILAFILQIYGGLDILFRNQDTTSQTRLEWMVFSVQAIAVLYVWELCYRVNTGWPLLVHHLVTILLIQLATASYFDTQNIVWIRFAILLGFYATTEQISFVALFFFRLRLCPAWHGVLFYAAAAQTFILKTIVTVAAIVYTFIVVYNVSDDSDDDVTNWLWFWRICFLPLLIVLYASQLYACKILYALGSRCSKAQAELLHVSKAAGEGGSSQKLQKRASIASIASRRRSELLLDDFENNSDVSFKRDSDLRASGLFKEQNEWAEFMASEEDFESREIETGDNSLRLDQTAATARATELIVLDEEIDDDHKVVGEKNEEDEAVLDA